MLLARSLKCIRIIRKGDSYGPHPEAWNLISLLPERTPYLEEIQIDVSPSTQNMRDILELKHLRRLSFSSFDHATVGLGYFKELERLPNIETLGLGSLPSGRPQAAEEKGPSESLHEFPALENISFTSYNRGAVQILSQLPSNTLKTIVLNHTAGKYDDEEEFDWDSEFSGEVLSFVTDKQFASLTKLQINSWGTLDPIWLNPLLRIHGIETFDLEFARCSYLTDEMVEAMTSAWPRLEVFRLYVEDGLCQPSLRSFRSFAKHCPNLQSLSLDFDTSAVPSYESHQESSTILPLERVSVFSVSSCACVHRKDVRSLTEYLRESLPSLVFAFVENRDNRIMGLCYDSRDWSGVFSGLLELNAEERRSLKNILQSQ
jgi:hypothetical protein